LGLLVLAFWLLAALFGPALLSRQLVDGGSAEVFASISASHWLGTDYLGRDMLIRVIDGARYTVGVALLATLLASSTGTVLALLAAASGKGLDATLSRLLDTLTAIPSKMFALIMVAGFGSSVSMLVFTAALIYVPGAYRIARSLAVNINALPDAGASVIAPAMAIASLTIAVKLVIDNLPGRSARERGARR